ncbi:MAG: DUF2066 domain-containing protein [Pseudomonadota bacterium]
MFERRITGRAVANARRTLAGLAAIIGLAFAGVASAEDSVFVVAKVPVQASADTATQAKDRAQDAGRRRALDILLRRLTPEAEWRYLPSLAASEPAPALADGEIGGVKQPIEITGRELVALEQSFEVYEEKSSSRLYRAFITYRFKPNSVRRLLKDAALPYSEAQTRTALVLPVLQTDSGVYLWEANNPWMAAWKSRPYTHELTPFVAPAGDVEDEATITANGALSLDIDAAADMARRYGISQVVVAHARLRQSDGEDKLTVRLLNAYSEAASVAGASDAATLGEDLVGENGGRAFDGGLGDDQGVGQDLRHTSDIYGFGASPKGDFAAEVGDVIASATGGEASGNFPILAERLIEAAIANYASGWKEETLIDHASDAVLAATAFFDGLGDWARIRGALIDTPLVGAVQISGLSPRGAEMDIRVFGDPSRLTTALENQGIVFWTEMGERWFLATPEVASRVRGQRFLRQRDRRRRFGDIGGDIGGDVEGVDAGARDERLAPAYGDMSPTPAGYRRRDE